MSSIDQNLIKSFGSPKTPNSYLISFEGLEGCGKSTQVKIFKESLENSGYKVFLFREPGGTAFGEGLRNSMLQAKEEITPLAQAHLFASSRAQLLAQEILPKLQQEKTVVILDRYLDSSLVYQGKAQGLGMQTVLELHQHAPLNTFPHITFYLKISLKTCEERLKIRGEEKDFFESKGQDFYQGLYDGHEELAQLFDKRICTLNGEQTPEKVADDLWKAWEKLS